MDAKKALVATRRTVGFVAFGGAWWSMKMSAILLRREFARTRENAQILGEMAKEVRGRFKGTSSTDAPDPGSFEEAARHAAAKGVSVIDVYRHFLTRKRIALCMAILFLCIGGAGLALGSWLGVLPMAVGTGLCLEMAWLAEFRLWQLRHRRLAANEQASVKDYATDPGAWRRALRFEFGACVDPAMRQYRAWLIGKRLGLLLPPAALALALLSSAPPAPFLLTAAIGLLIALLVELRLSALRQSLGRPHPRLAALRIELGVGYQRDDV